MAALSEEGLLRNFTAEDFSALWDESGDGLATRPTVTSISPNTAVVGGPDVTMILTGADFTPTTVILWNGSPEPTTFIDSSHISTLVKPSTASGPFTIPVTARTGARRARSSVNFTFTAA